MSALVFFLKQPLTVAAGKINAFCVLANEGPPAYLADLGERGYKGSKAFHV